MGAHRMHVMRRYAIVASPPMQSSSSPNLACILAGDFLAWAAGCKEETCWLGDPCDTHSYRGLLFFYSRLVGFFCRLKRLAVAL